MNNFKFEYKVDEKSVRKMILSGIGAKAMIQSALIPAGMFLIAYYLGKIESQPFGYFCFACGIAMMIWIDRFLLFQHREQSLSLRLC